MAIFIVLWPYLSTTKLRSVIRHNLGHSTGGAWKDKVEYLCKSNVIGRGMVYNILVLSGTHGSKNTASGFSDNTKLDKSLYNADKKTAQWLEENMAKKGFKICINVANMRDFSKPLRPKLDLCEFVNKENPNMVVMAWCYSTNGNFFQHL